MVDTRNATMHTLEDKDKHAAAEATLRHFVPPAETGTEVEAGLAGAENGTKCRMNVARQTFGERPAVFKNTLQEVLFVFMATAANMASSFLFGAAVVITASIGQDLGMSQGQVTWISAASS